LEDIYTHNIKHSVRNMLSFLTSSTVFRPSVLHYQILWHHFKYCNVGTRSTALTVFDFAQNKCQLMTITAANTAITGLKH